MSDVTLQHMTNGQNISVANTNFDKLQDNINNHSLQKDGGNNILFQDLDLNGHDLLNINSNVSKPNALLTVANGDARYYLQHQVPSPSNLLDATNKNYVDTAIASASGGIPPTSIATYPILNAIYAAAYVKGDGTTNDALNLQNAINAASLQGKTLVATGLKMKINSQVVIPTTLTADFSGSYLDCSSISSGTSVKITGSDSLSDKTSLGSIKGLVLYGSLISNHANPAFAVDGLEFSGSGGSAAGVALYDLKVFGFRDGITFTGPNTYLIRMYSPQVAQGWRYGMAAYANSNSGEAISIYGGTIANINNTSFNGAGVYVDPATTNWEWNFFGTSFDYNDISAQMNGGNLKGTNCHFENNNNNAHIICTPQSGKTKPTIILYGGQMGGGPGTVSWTSIPVESIAGRPSFIVCNSGSNDVIFENVVVPAKSNGFVTEIVTASNVAYMRMLRIRPVLDVSITSGSLWPPTPSQWVNKLFNSTTIAPWVANGAGGVTLSFDNTSVQSPDVGARMCVSTAGSSSSFRQKVGCTPGEIWLMKVWINISSITTGYCAPRVIFYAADGTTVVQDVIGLQINAATSGYQPAWLYVRVPSGAVTAECWDYYNSFTGTARFSNEHAWSI